MTPDFQIVAGDNPSIAGQLTGYTSIAGFTISMSIKENPTDTSPLFTTTASIIDPVAGTFSFPFTSQQTDQAENIYNYDVKVVDASGNTLHTVRRLMEITEPIT